MPNKNADLLIKISLMVTWLVQDRRIDGNYIMLSCPIHKLPTGGIQNLDENIIYTG